MRSVINRVFVLRNCIQVFSENCRYERPKARNLNNVCMHLTNYAVNKKSNGFEPSRHHDDGSKEHGVTWYARLGSYWDPAVAAVAAELAMQRHKEGQTREQVEQVEADIVAAARAMKRK